MIYLGSNPLAGQLKSKLFTTSGTLIVPNDVYFAYMDGCGGGGGGGGGDPTPGGGGGGGAAGDGVLGQIIPLTPGETITVTIGAGGIGGAVGEDGISGGTTVVAAAALTVRCGYGVRGQRGANPNGGGGGGVFKIGGATFGGGDGVGLNADYINQLHNVGWGSPFCTNYYYTTGAAGGALNFNGGVAYRTDPAIDIETSYISQGTGNASGGGGGSGGCGYFGPGGVGGSNGASGSAPVSGYGGGGGGGSGNSAGGDGASGVVRLYMFTAYSL